MSDVLTRANLAYRAACERAPVEVVHALLLDVVAELQDRGQTQAAKAAAGTAKTLVPMFGMHAEHERAKLPFWRRRRYVPPDYEEWANRYRCGEVVEFLLARIDEDARWGARCPILDIVRRRL